MNAPAVIDRSSARPVNEAGRYKLRVADYLMLDEAGAFRSEETELVDGWVIIMSPEWIPHMRVKDELSFRLRGVIERLEPKLVLGTGGSVDLSETDQPRPDIIVAARFAGEKAVAREDLLLVVEVSSSTLPFDLGDKAAAYARAEVPEYWVVDVGGGVVHRMWDPKGETYTQRDEVKFGQPLASATMPKIEIMTTSL